MIVGHCAASIAGLLKSSILNRQNTEVIILNGDLTAGKGTVVNRKRSFVFAFAGLGFAVGSRFCVCGVLPAIANQAGIQSLIGIGELDGNAAANRHRTEILDDIVRVAARGAVSCTGFGRAHISTAGQSDFGVYVVIDGSLSVTHIINNAATLAVGNRNTVC